MLDVASGGGGGVLGDHGVTLHCRKAWWLLLVHPAARTLSRAGWMLTYRWKVLFILMCALLAALGKKCTVQLRMPGRKPL